MYPAATKLLHWATAVALVGQLVVGYQLDDGDDQARAALEAREDRLEDLADRRESREEQLERRADALSDREPDDDTGGGSLLTLHVFLGLTVLLLAVVRLVRRRVVPLPPWAESLTDAERSWAHRTEQVLYLSLVAMPLTGIGLLTVSDDLLPIHVATHVVFFTALAAHLGLVLRHQLVLRDGLLRRML